MPKRIDITNEMVNDLYFVKDFSVTKVAKILKCDCSVIANRVKSMDKKMKQKTASQHVFDGMKKSIPISNNLLEILDGEMLGDGCIYVSRSNCQGYFKESIGYDKKEWGEFLINIFKNNNILIGGSGLISRKDKPGWSFFTRSTIELGNIQRRWYKNNNKFNSNKKSSFSNRKNIKIIPIDLKLTPNTLLHWYIGDGCFRKRGSIGLATCGFSFDEIEFLRFLLKRDFNLKTSHTADGKISIPRYEAVRMLEIMGECPVECYKYKWDISYNRKTKVKDTINMKIIDNFIKKEIKNV